MPETGLYSASARSADTTGPAGWMTVFRCVSSKSKTCELMPLISAACRTSSARCGRARWPAPGPRTARARRSPYRPSRAATRRRRSPSSSAACDALPCGPRAGRRRTRADDVAGQRARDAGAGGGDVALLRQRWFDVGDTTRGVSAPRPTAEATSGTTGDRAGTSWAAIYPQSRPAAGATIRTRRRGSAGRGCRGCRRRPTPSRPAAARGST